MRSAFHVPILLCCALLALTLTACGDDDEQPAPRARATTSATPTPTAAREAVEDTKTKPAIPKPSGKPPTELEIDDIVEGKGRAAKAGDTVEMQYVGVSHSTGEEFDASWERGEPFVFKLGAGSVIPGWDEGIAGMKEGGRRKLVIPPAMAYGATGQPPAIGPDETLVFVVDLQKIQ